MKKALLPVKRRLRCQRAVKGLCWGAMAAGIAAAGVMALSFFAPLPMRGMLLAVSAALAPLTACAYAFFPVKWMTAARAADRCGLQERAQTALLLTGRTDEMARLQREDAKRTLAALDVRRALPLRVQAAPLAAAGACLLICAALMFAVNPQDRVLRAWEQFRQRMAEPARQLDKLTQTLEDERLDAETMRELRRMLGELARKTATARDTREALSAVSQAQQQMEKWLREGQNDLAQALQQAGMDAAAQALNASAQSMQEALEKAMAQSDAAQLAQQLQNAAQSAQSGAARQALQNAAQAVSQGSIAGAAQALGEMNASAAQIASALQGVKAAAGMPGGGSQQTQASAQGQGGGQGQGQGMGQGQGQGSGAGMGSTNEENGGSGSAGTALHGAPQYKLGQYESIYDPTRLGDGGQITQSTGRVSEQGDSMELTLAPGLGTAEGGVPYDQVAGEYRDTAVQRAQEAALPAYARDWINEYFSALTD